MHGQAEADFRPPPSVVVVFVAHEFAVRSLHKGISEQSHMLHLRSDQLVFALVFRSCLYMRRQHNILT